MTEENETKKDVILVVDDNATNLRLLFDYLRETGFEVLVTEDGEGALEGIDYVKPDLILLDVMMPGIDGFETCRRLKAREQTKDIPVIFMSALSDTVDKVNGFEAGGVDYITKPVQYEELLARISVHLMLRKLQKTLQAQNIRLQQEIQERQQAEMALQKANQELYRLAVLDSLTQLANRRRFDVYLTQVWRKMTQTDSPLALILCDIDYFKRFNDTYGHQAGDDCLRKVAQAISRAARRTEDLTARYGGEEFALILPDTKTEETIEVAHTIRKEIEQLKIAHASSTINEYVTLSIGLSSVIPDHKSSPETLIARVDEALYEAKARGRNRIILKTDTAQIVTI